MKNNIREFHFPCEVREAASLLAKLKSKALVLAGGTRLTRTLSPTIEAAVDISDLPLRHIKADKNWLRIGALCSMDDLEVSPIVAKWASGVIAKTAGFGSNALARSMGTVGGNIVRAHPFNNLPPAFLALGAQVAYSDGSREKTMPFAEIRKPEVMHKFGSRFLLTEVRVPAETRNWSAAAGRLSATKTDWESTANCVVAVEKKGGLCRRAAIALGALVPRAMRFSEAERTLEGRPCVEASAKAAAAAVVEALVELTCKSPAKAYAREVAGVMIRRALMEAFQDTSAA
ncbi:MAG: FAD binding domain-containing protein [candidate division NC10 bacterium]